MKKFAFTLLATMLSFASAHAGPNGLDVSPYEPAQECVQTHLPQEWRHTLFTVTSFPDETGHVNIAADAGNGAVSTQGLASTWNVSLGALGVGVVPSDESYRSLMAWMHPYNSTGLTPGFMGNGQTFIEKDPKTGQPVNVNHVPLMEGTQAQPQFAISGGIVSADLVPGDVVEGGIPIIEAGFRRYHMDVVMDITVWKLPYVSKAADGHPVGDLGGYMVDSFRLKRRIWSSEIKLGSTSIGRIVSGLFSMDFAHAERGDVQYLEAVTIDGAAARVLADLSDMHACDALIDYDDNVLQDAPSDGPARPAAPSDKVAEMPPSTPPSTPPEKLAAVPAVQPKLPPGTMPVVGN